jgi:hypothetical protein
LLGDRELDISGLWQRFRIGKPADEGGRATEK